MKSLPIKMSVFLNSLLTGIVMAFSEMKTHKLRSLLSVLGVMLGVASLVSMLTLMGGIDKFLNEKMTQWIGTIWFWKKQDPSFDQKIIWSRSPGLRLSDGSYLKRNSKVIKDIPLVITRYGKVRIGNRIETTVLRGVDSSSLELEKEDIKILYGRWINESEFKTGKLNCVISWHIAGSLKEENKLKDTIDLIGKDLVYNRTKLNIIGVFIPIDINNNSWHMQRSIVTALKTMQNHITGQDPDPGYLRIQITDAKKLKHQAKSVAISLTQHHRGVEDFEYQAAEWANKVNAMLKNISLVMAVISALSLSVGGLSIMNVMLSSISERIKEIGIRKALGAQNFQITTQFIAETTTLSFTGGCFGILLGSIPLLFKDSIVKATDGAIEPTILTIHLLLTFLIIVLTGIIFGIYPALKASKLNPVEALKYE